MQALPELMKLGCMTWLDVFPMRTATLQAKTYASASLSVHFPCTFHALSMHAAADC